METFHIRFRNKIQWLKRDGAIRTIEQHAVNPRFQIINNERKPLEVDKRLPLSFTVSEVEKSFNQSFSPAKVQCSNSFSSLPNKKKFVKLKVNEERSGVHSPQLASSVQKNPNRKFSLFSTPKRERSQSYNVLPHKKLIQNSKKSITKAVEISKLRYKPLH